MYYLKKSLVIVITGIILFGLAGCSGNTNKRVATNANVKTVKETAENIDSINLNKLRITYPSNWTKRGDENEIFFDDENKQTVGGISLVGYYGNNNAALPNHSETLDSEDINTNIGKGKLFTLKRSNPAASNNNETWNEVHAIIPSNKNNVAYDFWIKWKKDILLNILKSIK